MPSVYLECVDGISSKFWQCSIKGCDVTSTYGKIGGAPSSTTKSFPTAEKAQAFYDKEANSKMNKGYQMKGKKVKAAPAKVMKAAMKVAMKAMAKAKAMKVMKVAVKARQGPAGGQGALLHRGPERHPQLRQEVRPSRRGHRHRQRLPQHRHSGGG
ncbi:unnamed protein product [Effrenium voratum]|nr:unnamed protein product [Effrenium voratum]